MHKFNNECEPYKNYNRKNDKEGNGKCQCNFKNRKMHEDFAIVDSDMKLQDQIRRDKIKANKRIRAAKVAGFEALVKAKQG